MVRDAKRCDRRRDERHEPVAPRERPTHKWLEVDMDARAQNNAPIKPYRSASRYSLI